MMQDAYYNRGIVCRALGDNKGAIDDYDQVIKLKPDYADAYYNRAYTHAFLNENQKAIADYRKAIELYLATVLNEI
jgi:tetratricopeptide (TPR) repeat protein